MAISWIVETHDNLSSTQDLLRNYADQGKPEGIAIQALEQTGGRGRHGRVWVSERGNLYLSFLLRPNCSPSLIGQISVLIGAALGKTIEPLLKKSETLTLKWPNDVLISSHKCAGVLIETELKNGLVDYAATGIGVNIVSAPADIGTALNDHVRTPVDPLLFRDQFLENVSKFYNLWKEGFGPVRAEWLRLAHAKGTALQVKIGDQIQQGTFQNIDSEGNLLILDASGQAKKVTAGEVYLIRT